MDAQEVRAYFRGIPTGPRADQEEPKGRKRNHHGRRGGQQHTESRQQPAQQPVEPPPAFRQLDERAGSRAGLTRTQRRRVQQQRQRERQRQRVPVPTSEAPPAHRLLTPVPTSQALATHHCRLWPQYLVPTSQAPAYDDDDDFLLPPPLVSTSQVPASHFPASQPAPAAPAAVATMHAVLPFAFPAQPSVREWKRVERNLKKLRLIRHEEGAESIVPTSLEEYREHVAEHTSILAKEEETRRMQAAQIAEMESESLTRVPFLDLTSSPEVMAYEGPLFTQESVFAPLHMGSAANWEVAPWPSADELREDGDERHTSGMGRFMPVPREHGNATINWKHKAYKKALPLDDAHPVPPGFGSQFGLLYDENGRPYDDSSDSGCTAYVEKNPFDGMAQLEYELQKLSAEGERQKRIDSFLRGVLVRSPTPPHPLANNQQGNIKRPYSLIREHSGKYSVVDAIEAADDSSQEQAQEQEEAEYESHQGLLEQQYQEFRQQQPELRRPEPRRERIYYQLQPRQQVRSARPDSPQFGASIFDWPDSDDERVGRSRPLWDHPTEGDFLAGLMLGSEALPTQPERRREPLLPLSPLPPPPPIGWERSAGTRPDQSD